MTGREDRSKPNRKRKLPFYWFTLPNIRSGLAWARARSRELGLPLGWQEPHRGYNSRQLRSGVRWLKQVTNTFAARTDTPPTHGREGTLELNGLRC